MDVRALLTALLAHTADGRTLNEEVLLHVDGEVRALETSYSNGTFILIAGERVSGQ
jgi:hypothetical protein